MALRPTRNYRENRQRQVPPPTLKGVASSTHRHSGLRRNPGAGRWTPAFAGVTVGRPPHIFIRIRGPQGAWVITMKIASNQHRKDRQHPFCHSRESGNPGSRNVGVAAKSPTPPPLDSGLRRNDEPVVGGVVTRSGQYAMVSPPSSILPLSKGEGTTYMPSLPNWIQACNRNDGFTQMWH